MTVAMRADAQRLANKMTEITRQSFPDYKWVVIGQDGIYSLHIGRVDYRQIKDGEISVGYFDLVARTFWGAGVASSHPNSPKHSTHFAVRIDSSHRLRISGIVTRESIYQDIEWLSAHHETLSHQIECLMPSEKAHIFKPKPAAADIDIGRAVIEHYSAAWLPFMMAPIALFSLAAVAATGLAMAALPTMPCLPNNGQNVSVSRRVTALDKR